MCIIAFSANYLIKTIPGFVFVLGNYPNVADVIQDPKNKRSQVLQ